MLVSHTRQIIIQFHLNKHHFVFIPFPMGQTSSTVEKNQQEQLKLVDQNEQLYVNVRSQRMYTKRSIMLGDIADRQHQFNIYMFRRLNDGFVVSVDYCSAPEKLEICSSYTTLTYFIQHQKNTLLDKRVLPLREGFTLLLHVLKGFSILYDKFGYFTPNSRLIFFNHLNQAKVWINQDLRVTHNIQNPHGPKNITQENLMVREVVKIFDSLRDPNHPMLQYSQFLPENFLTFEFTIDCFLKKSVEMSCKDFSQKKVLTEVRNIIKFQSPPIQIKQNHPISYQTSPINSPQQTYSPRGFKKQNQHVLSFTYQSPERSSFQTPTYRNSLEKEQFKKAAKMSLKNTSIGIHPYHAMNPSREFTSTMPNSIRNSGMFEKQVIIEKIDPTPSISRKNSDIDIKIEKNQIKKNDTQRYSEVQQQSLSLEYKHQPKFLKVSLEERTKRASEIICNNTERSQNQLHQEEKQSYKFIQKHPKNQSGPTLKDPPSRRQFHNHKRHQTDFMMLQRDRMRDSDETQKNQISMIDGNNLSKFRLNTIKSIHLLDEDKQLDHAIIVDLKHIINKYRKLA